MSRSVDARAPMPDREIHGDGPASWLRHLLAARGGFTLHPRTGDQLDDGLAVCADPAVTIGFPFEHWVDEQVNAWVQRCVERAGVTDPHDVSAAPDLHLGGWLDRSGWVWLDVVRVFPPRHHEAALAYGRQHRQRAIFDLGRHEVVSLQLEGAR